MNDYEKLKPEMKKLFDRAYKNHLSNMGATEQEKHGMDQITKIKVNVLESCFEVYYDNGEWYKYFRNGTQG